MLNDQTRHRIRLARRLAASAVYALTHGSPRSSARSVYKAVVDAEDALEDALHDIRSAREAIEGIPDSGTIDEATLSMKARTKVAAREARAQVEGHNARCAQCDAYYDNREQVTCPHCGCDFHWEI
jgi:hypothetical protein